MLPWWMIGVLALCTLLGAFLVLRLRRARRRRPGATELGPLPSCVRLLTTEDDLRDAVERAVAHERLIAQRTTARIDRYHRIVDEPSEPVTGGELLELDSSSGSLLTGRSRPEGRASTRISSSRDGHDRHEAPSFSPQPPPDAA